MATMTGIGMLARSEREEMTAEDMDRILEANVIFQRGEGGTVVPLNKEKAPENLQFDSFYFVGCHGFSYCVFALSCQNAADRNHNSLA